MKRFIFLFLILFYSNAHAWGVLGHKIVANVAEATLSLRAKSELAKLIPNKKLADVCSWADQVRNYPEYKYTAPWHYADIPDGETYETSEHNIDGDVVVALEKQIALLSNQQTPVKERIEALKFVTHFMGDIHQPLHVGRPDDRGGNLIKVIYSGQIINLHSLWDSRFVAELIMGLGEYNQKIVQDVPPLPGFTLSDIVNEDLALRKDVYHFSDNVIDAEYAQKAREIVASRLQLAGERLGIVLNSAL